MSKMMQAQRRLGRRTAIGVALLCALAATAVVVPPAGATTPAQGRILAKPCLDLHSYLSVASQKVGCIPFNTTIAIQCTDAGDKVAGPYGSSLVWDVTTYGGKTGYVPDAWVYTGTNNPVAPACAGKGKGRVVRSPCLKLRSSATEATATNVLTCVYDTFVITITCTKRGQAVLGPWGTSTLWDQTTFQNHTGFVPDAWVYTATRKPVAPSC